MKKFFNICIPGVDSEQNYQIKTRFDRQKSQKGSVSMEVSTYIMVVFVRLSMIYNNKKDACKSQECPPHIDIL